MIGPINTKELCKLLRADGKNGSVIWKRENGQHFISNRHYAVRFDELPKDVMVTLFSIFYKLADEGQTLTSVLGSIDERDKPVDFGKAYQPEKQNIEGSKTPFIRDMGKKYFATVFKFPNRVVYLDERFVKIANFQNEAKTMGDAPYNPVYLAGNELMILPIQIKNDNTVINELIESEKTG